MSESSETPKKPGILYGPRNDEESMAVIESSIHRSRVYKKPGWFGRLFGKREDITYYDARAISEAGRPPSIFRHDIPEAPVEEGKFTVDRKGRRHRVR